jgi:hypothetical protein
MTGEGRNLPRQLIAQKIIPSIARRNMRAMTPRERRRAVGNLWEKLAHTRVDVPVLVFVLIAGILAAITTNVSYWNWYGFPGVYTASYILIEIVGFLLVGVVAALLLPKRAPAA